MGVSARSSHPARCILSSVTCTLQEQAARQAGAAAAAADALTAFDAGLAPLWARLDPWRDSVPPCRLPPDQAPYAGAGAARDASALEALVARVSAATGLSVTLARGMSGSGGGQPPGGGAAPAARALCVPTAGRRVHVRQ